MRVVWIGVFLAFLVSCGGTDAPPVGGGTTPAAVSRMERFLRDGLINGVAVVSGLTVLTDTLDDEAARIAAGITFDEDTSPGAPPNTYIVEMPFDSNGDGESDATITGRATFSDPPPDVPLFGFSGSLDLSVDLGPIGSITAMLEFTFGVLGIQVWGTLSMEDLLSNEVVDFTVPESDPVVVRVSTSGLDEDANLCYADLEGDVEVQVEGPFGMYSALWSFLFGSRTIQTSGRMHMPVGAPPGEEPDTLPDGSISLPVCRPASIQDWEGQFLLDWFCVPQEEGESRLFFEVTGPDTVLAQDEHPIGSGQTIDFVLTADPGNPHVLRGFFEETESGGTYREDVIFVLAPSTNTWTQNNVYEYQDGPLMGTGGVCGGLGTRIR